MYQHIVATRILFSVGIGLLIFSLVFGWIAFSVPDWLQFYEVNGLKNETNNDFKKFGLWYKCIFLIDTNDFTCSLWNHDAPSFVRVAQVLVPISLAFSCLSFLTACIAFICRRAFITTTLFAGLFSFLSFVFMIIGLTVFSLESLVYVDRLRLDKNQNPRLWGMWLLIPNLILSFLTSICFFVASILNWCDQRNMKVTGILSHSAEKYDGSVCKLPSESNATTAVKKPYQYQDYPTACYQLNGLNNNNNNNNQQQNSMGYPPPPSYPGPGYQPTPPGLFGYSRATSPTINPMYPYSNYDSYHGRHHMTENSEMDEPRTTRSRRRARSHSRRHSNRCSRSYSSRESSPMPDHNPKPTQFVPAPMPYYQPKIQSTPMTSNNVNSQPISYMIPQVKQQFVEEKPQLNTKPTSIIRYTNGQPSVVSNPSQPVYTIAYRANNGGNIHPSNVISGPAATTYVTATRNQIAEMNSLNSDSDNEDTNYRKLKKININEAWAWHKMH